MSAKEHRIAEITDLLKLSDEEFERMLPCLRVWRLFALEADVVGFECEGFVWTDDGDPKVNSVTITIRDR